MHINTVTHDKSNVLLDTGICQVAFVSVEVACYAAEGNVVLNLLNSKHISTGSRDHIGNQQTLLIGARLCVRRTITKPFDIEGSDRHRGVGCTLQDIHRHLRHVARGEHAVVGEVGDVGDAIGEGHTVVKCGVDAVDEAALHLRFDRVGVDHHAAVDDVVRLGHLDA